jgi:hypothetical protein
VAGILVPGRRPCLRHGIAQRLERQASAELRDLIRKKPGRPALEEFAAAILADRAHGPGKVALGPGIAFGHGGAGALAEYPAGFAVAAEQRRTGLQVARQRARHRHAEPGEPFGRRHKLLPAHRTMPDVHQSDGTHADGNIEGHPVDWAGCRCRRKGESLSRLRLGIMHDADASSVETG